LANGRIHADHFLRYTCAVVVSRKTGLERGSQVARVKDAFSTLWAVSVIHRHLHHHTFAPRCVTAVPSRRAATVAGVMAYGAPGVEVTVILCHGVGVCLRILLWISGDAGPSMTWVLERWAKPALRCSEGVDAYLSLLQARDWKADGRRGWWAGRGCGTKLVSPYCSRTTACGGRGWRGSVTNTTARGRRMG